MIEAVCKMSFGNGLGAAFNTDYSLASYVEKNYGNIIVEVKSEKDLVGLDYRVVATLNDSEKILLWNGYNFYSRSLCNQ